MAAEATTAAPVLAGNRLAGSYELLDEIGCGGMGRVYRARRLADGRIVAVKAIRIEDIAPDYERRLRREPEIQRGLGHENIVSFIDWFRIGEQFLLVMEYVDGENLERIIRRSGPLPVDRAVDIARQLLEAVGHLHSLDVIHRDIKPSNILIGRDGRTKLADFGIAKYIWQQGGTQTRRGVGTPEYMSPEQARGEEIDGRSDIYAIGITLFEMLVGHSPFATLRETPAGYMRVIHDVLQTPLPDPRQERPEIPDALAELLFRTTAKDRQMRPATCAELLAELDAAMGSASGPAQIFRGAAPDDRRPAGWRARAEPLLRYLRTGSGRRTMVLIALLLLAFSGIAAVLSHSGPELDARVPMAAGAVVDPLAVVRGVAAAYEHGMNGRDPVSLAGLYADPADYFGHPGLDRSTLRAEIIKTLSLSPPGDVAIDPNGAVGRGDTAIDASWKVVGNGATLRVDTIHLLRRGDLWLIARHGVISGGSRAIRASSGRSRQAVRGQIVRPGRADRGEGEPGGRERGHGRGKARGKHGGR